MQFTRIAALIASAAIVVAQPFFGIQKRAIWPSLTTVQGFVGYPYTLSQTYRNYIYDSTFWVGSTCRGYKCFTTTTQLFASAPCYWCRHYITSGVTTDSDGDDVTFTGDVLVTTGIDGLETYSNIDTFPKNPRTKASPRTKAAEGAYVTITQDVATSCDQSSLCTTTTFPHPLLTR